MAHPTGGEAVSRGGGAASSRRRNSGQLASKEETEKRLGENICI